MGARRARALIVLDCVPEHALSPRATRRLNALCRQMPSPTLELLNDRGLTAIEPLGNRTRKIPNSLIFLVRQRRRKGYVNDSWSSLESV